MSKLNGETAFQRSKIYRLLSYCFSSPTEDLVEFLKSREFTRELDLALNRYPSRNGNASLVEEIRGIIVEGKMPSLDIVEMKDEYIRLFTLKSNCPPYETEYYRTAVSPFSSEEMADVAGFYRAVGMAFSKDRPDNIATELEFMYLVTLKEAEAAFKSEPNKVELCLSIERNFLKDHLGRWVDAFSEALLSEGSGIYFPISLLLKCWINLECLYLSAEPEKVRDIVPENEVFFS